MSQFPIWANVGMKGIQLTELAERSSLSRPACSELVTELETPGYLERRPGPQDGRAKRAFCHGGLSLRSGVPDPSASVLLDQSLELRISTSLDFREHLTALEAAGMRLAQIAVESDLAADVPTCPGWDVRALLAHQTMVHRWATAHVTGADATALPSQTEIRRTVSDIHGYYDEGLRYLLIALESAPPDLDAMTFLKDAPGPREFWARRQAHETTIHMVDGVAASLARMPTASEVDLDPGLAVDGIDELLAGFFTRGRSKLHDGESFAMLVEPDDRERRWHVQVDETLTVSAEPAGSPRLSISGTAAAIYLGLWNRGDELTLEGDSGLMDRWRVTQKIRWG